MTLNKINHYSYWRSVGYKENVCRAFEPECIGKHACGQATGKIKKYAGEILKKIDLFWNGKGVYVGDEWKRV